MVKQIKVKLSEIYCDYENYNIKWEGKEIKDVENPHKKNNTVKDNIDKKNIYIYILFLLSSLLLSYFIPNKLLDYFNSLTKTNTFYCKVQYDKKNIKHILIKHFILILYIFFLNTLFIFFTLYFLIFIFYRKKISINIKLDKYNWDKLYKSLKNGYDPESYSSDYILIRNINKVKESLNNKKRFSIVFGDVNTSRLNQKIVSDKKYKFLVVDGNHRTFLLKNILPNEEKILCKIMDN